MSEEVTEIKVDGSYDINAYFKKSLTEIEMFRHESGKALNTEILWRNGTFRITITNEEECEYLQSSLGEDGEIWDFEDYENIEMIDSFDGCAEDFVFYGSGDNTWSDEDKEKLEEDYDAQLESEEWQSRYEFLEEKGYESQGCNWQIHGGVQAVEADGEANSY